MAGTNKELGSGSVWVRPGGHELVHFGSPKGADYVPIEDPLPESEPVPDIEPVPGSKPLADVEPTPEEDR